MPQFFTSSGWLTSYALACGYIHKTELSCDKSVVMERRDCGDYGVTVWDRDARDATTSYGATLRDGLAFFESFERVSQARAAYAKAVGRLRYRFEAAPDVQREVII